MESSPDVDLAAAYERFFHEAETGGFVDPPEGEWSAEQVVAHITLNDKAMIAVADSIAAGAPAAFDNVAVQEPAALAEWISDCGNMAGLITEGRKVAEAACERIASLTGEQLETAVPCRFESDGELVLEQPMPWKMVAEVIQATRHLPGHTEQLQALH